MAEDFPFPRQEVVSHEVADADAFEVFYSVAEFVEHVADLAFVSLSEDDTDPSHTERFDAFGHGQAVLQTNASGEAFDVVVVEILIESDVVFLLNLMFGM